MKSIDSHQHFWQYQPQKHSWINDEMVLLKKDFMPQDLLKELQAHGIDSCVAVQAEQSEAETLFLVDLARQFEFIAGVVGWVDLKGADIAARLEHFTQFPKIKGFRHVAQDEPDASFLIRESFTQGIALLTQFDFCYDILIYPHQLEAALQLVQLFPQQKFVIDHMAKPRIKEGLYQNWSKQMTEISKCQNVWCKVSGMVTEADWGNWNYHTFSKYLDLVFESFGPDRIMFGSDWPVCLLAGSYSDVKSILDTYLKSFSQNEKEKIWAGNAMEFYGLE